MPMKRETSPWKGKARPFETLQVAEAFHNRGGKVVVQVKEIVKTGTLDPRLVHIPAQYVDYVVPATDLSHNHMITFNIENEPAFCGDCRKILEHKKTDTALTTKKIIAGAV